MHDFLVEQEKSSRTPAFYALHQFNVIIFASRDWNGTAFVFRDHFRHCKYLNALVEGYIIVRGSIVEYISRGREKERENARIIKVTRLYALIT